MVPLAEKPMRPLRGSGERCARGHVPAPPLGAGMPMDAGTQTTRRRSRRRGRLAMVGAVAGALALLYAGPMAYQRYALCNFHEVVPGQVYRSAQPGEHEIRQWVSQYGLRTLFNLRGDLDHPEVVREMQLARELNLSFVSIPLSRHALPERSAVLSIIQTIETAPRPILLHCRAGADRSGVVSVMAAMAIGGQDYASAREQLSWRYLHFGTSSKVAIEDFLKEYEAHCRRRGTPTGGWREVKDWAVNVYGKESP